MDRTEDLEFEDDSGEEEQYMDDDVVDEEMDVGQEEDDEEDLDKRVYLPGEQMPDDQQLVMDRSAYESHVEFTTEWPCLSFSVLGSPAGAGGAASGSSGYPATVYLVAGTQAAEAHQNQVNIIKVSNITKMREGDESDDEEEDDEDELPVLDYKTVKHRGGVNRITVAPHDGCIAATWADTGKVHLWDLANYAQALENPSFKEKGINKPIHTCELHRGEGYAMGWSPVKAFRFASGDCQGRIHLWDRHDSGDWMVAKQPCTGHTDSVEDIHWSPSEANVFASCSVDKTIKIWDARSGSARPAISVDAHDTDVNVMSWNRREQHLMVSGGDDGMFKVWDLRTFMSGKPEAVATFKWHTAPITSIEWHPIDASVIAVAGEDNQISLWDLAVEEDAEAGSESLTGPNGEKVPPQLLFIHQGQTHIKETHWHPQLAGMLVSTAANGFNIFKTISV